MSMGGFGKETLMESYLKIPCITICHFCKSLCSLSLCLIFNHCLVVSPCLAVWQVAGCLLVCVASEVHLPHVKPWVSRILPMNRWCAMAGVMIFGPGMSCFGIYIKTWQKTADKPMGGLSHVPETTTKQTGGDGQNPWNQLWWKNWPPSQVVNGSVRQRYA